LARLTTGRRQRAEKGDERAAVGRYLRAARGKVVGGYRLETKTTANGARFWVKRLYEVAGDAAAAAEEAARREAVAALQAKQRMVTPDPFECLSIGKVMARPRPPDEYGPVGAFLTEESVGYRV